MFSLVVTKPWTTSACVHEQGARSPAVPVSGATLESGASSAAPSGRTPCSHPPLLVFS
jgi:hypothetical protein